jgi:hypothetical protein
VILVWGVLGMIGDHVNPWGVELCRTLQTVWPETPREQSAYDKCLEQISAREEARLDRVHGAVGVMTGYCKPGLTTSGIGRIERRTSSLIALPPPCRLVATSSRRRCHGLIVRIG